MIDSAKNLAKRSNYKEGYGGELDNSRGYAQDDRARKYVANVTNQVLSSLTPETTPPQGAGRQFDVSD